MATVFIIDDDQSILRLIRILLEGNGFQVVETAVNGQIAINKFRALPEKPDIILMDYRMPIKNGLEATIEILKMGYHSRIIFETADEIIKQQALKVGVFSVIIKPFDLNELLNSIDDALNDKAFETKNV